MNNGNKKLKAPSPLGRARSFFDFSVFSMDDNGHKLVLWAILIPRLCEVLFAKIVGMLDTIMLSKYAENAVGASTSANQVLAIITNLLLITQLGTTITVSIELGRGNREKAGRITATAGVLVLLTSLVAGVALFFAAEPLLVAMNLSGDALEHGVAYLKLRGLFLFVTMFSSFVNTMLICNGKAIYVMIREIFGNLLLVLLHYLLLIEELIPSLIGTRATATATIAATLVATIFSAFMFFKSKCAFTPRLYLGCLKGLYGVGIPGSVAAISYTFSQTVTVGFIGSIGTAALNAYSYINSISSYTYFVSSALGAAVSIFAGRYFGKCDATSIKKMLRLSIFFAVCINVL